MNIKEEKALFSLFHHDVDYQNVSPGYDSTKLLNLSNKKPLFDNKDIADTVYNIVTDSLSNYQSNEVSLTLTGGMDSRVVLAALLKAGVKPNCVSFGDPGAKDIVFSKRIADGLGLPFHNACNKSPDKEWYNTWVLETIKRDKGNAHLHRAHRTAAIAEHVEKYNPNILFTGHMGGEGIRGDAYTDYITSSFFENVNEGRIPLKRAINEVSKEYFINISEPEINSLAEKISALKWMQNDRETNLLYFLYEFDAKIHHSQDLRIYQTYIPEVVPVFLQKKYLEKLYSSPYHFLGRDNSAKSRLSMPYLYCKIIEDLYPALLDYPFANGFKPKEFLYGMWYYIPVKMYRDRRNKGKFSPSFSYGDWYIEFVKEHIQNIDPDIWEIYDKKAYFTAFEAYRHKTNEGYWHKFSNPIYFDLVNKYNKGML